MHARTRAALPIIIFARGMTTEMYARIISTITGMDLDEKKLALIGERIHNLESALWVREGIGRIHMISIGLRLGWMRSLRGLGSSLDLTARSGLFGCLTLIMRKP